MQSRSSTGFGSAPYSERWRSFGLLVLIAAWWLCGLSVGFEPGLLFQPDGLSNASALIQGLLNPTFEADFVQRVLRLTVESFAIGLTGLALALFLGVPLGLLGARPPLDSRTVAKCFAGLFYSLGTSCLSVGAYGSSQYP